MKVNRETEESTFARRGQAKQFDPMAVPHPKSGLQMMTGTMSIFFAEVIILAVGFMTVVFLARKLGPIQFGLFALASRLVTWIEWTSTSFFSDTTIKFVGEASDWRPIATSVVQLYLLSGVITAASLWLLSSPLSRLFDEPIMATYLKLFAIEVPIFSLTCAMHNILVGKGCFKEKAMTSVIRWIARFMLIVFLVEMGLSINGAIMGSIGASLIELIFSTFYIRPSIFNKRKFPKRQLWQFAKPLFMSLRHIVVILSYGFRTT